jgi:hypothetical protein
MVWRRPIVTAFAGVAALALTFLGTSTARAQGYPGDLPPGVLAAFVNGEPIDANTFPTTTDLTPTISGQLEPGPTSVSITILSDPVDFTAAVDPVTGEFSATVPVELTPGAHQLYFDDALVGSFSIQATSSGGEPPDDDDDGAAPPTGGGVNVLPSTGAGSAAPASSSAPTAGLAGVLVALLALGLWQRRRSDRTRPTA